VEVPPNALEGLCRFWPSGNSSTLTPPVFSSVTNEGGSLAPGISDLRLPIYDLRSRDGQDRPAKPEIANRKAGRRGSLP